MVNLIVADDHTVVRQALCEMLENKGDFNVVAQAGDGAQLLEILQSREQPDLVIMDVNMPNLNGIETLKAMEERFSHNDIPPVLVISSNDQRQYVSEAINAGARGYIPKDADVSELLHAISSVLHGKTYLSPNIMTSMAAPQTPQVMSSDNPFNVLTKRELEITKFLANGLCNREIGEKLAISIRTVDTHRSNILHKLNVRNNSDLTRLAIKHNLI